MCACISASLPSVQAQTGITESCLHCHSCDSRSQRLQHTCRKPSRQLKHLHNVETHFYCPKTFINIGISGLERAISWLLAAPFLLGPSSTVAIKSQAQKAYRQTHLLGLEQLSYVLAQTSEEGTKLRQSMVRILTGFQAQHTQQLPCKR